ILAGSGGVNIEIAARFDVVKERVLVEGEIEFGRVEDVKQYDLVAARAETGEVFPERLNGRQEIGDQHHQSAFAHDFDDTLERRGEIGGGAGGGLFEREHQVPQMAGAMARGEILADLLVES